MLPSGLVPMPIVRSLPIAQSTQRRPANPTSSWHGCLAPAGTTPSTSATPTYSGLRIEVTSAAQASSSRHQPRWRQVQPRQLSRACEPVAKPWSPLCSADSSLQSQMHRLRRKRVQQNLAQRSALDLRPLTRTAAYVRTHDHAAPCRSRRSTADRSRSGR